MCCLKIIRSCGKKDGPMKSIDLFDLKGRTAIVTGGSRGLGLQMARGLAEAGSDVVICSRKLESCQEAADAIQSIGVRSLAFRCDLNSDKEIDRMVGEVGDCWARSISWSTIPEEHGVLQWKTSREKTGKR